MKNYYLPFILLLAACGTSQKSDQEIFSEQQREVLDPVKDIDLEVEKSELEKQLIAQGLVNVEEVIPGIRVKLKYSTTDNFFKQDVYGDLTKAFLQPEVAERLKKAQEMLQREFPDYTLLVYDGVRPSSVQQILWDNLDKPDSLKPLYVADPKKGSLHNFGVAVDLTIFDTKADSPLDMGTGYDFFGYAAYPDREQQMLDEGKISAAQIANRAILRKVMTTNGFTGIGSEWWHFNAFSRKEAGEKFEIIK
ncbi:D-alanyl-D-alanine dipeptidase [Algoriphagus locisalis]|uniref:D-alanyl-D-alanine dipeptidase n=1 Tax=Algoriphagus locisalis TaxID=305507 RepID=A0A1I7CXW9_9BACT|nr:M15 family metallopeptidase [Algoriphagus locisalis]SFU04281.1 D-alanyl-D-alanine dipeptidase [Algoriphagus locisalis]